MTDDEIILSMECCNSVFSEHRCKDCPMQGNFRCSFFAIKNGIDLINRQKAEIEGLEQELELARADKVIAEKHEKDARDLFKDVVIQLKTAKSEARKEFAEQFAKELSKFDMSTVGLPDYDRGYKDCMTAVEDTIDNLLEEMEEKKNGKENE